MLRRVQDCTTAMRRWLATGNNSAELMAYLRAQPVDSGWLRSYRRLHRDLERSVGDAHQLETQLEEVGPRPR
ncbi:hypothetical protein I1A62_02135 (plasmid) [Rhodococcus sp. USK10]|nr:hypothetical protein I1A62_02135 [Rhodococcus sp. USK10]